MKAHILFTAVICGQCLAQPANKYQRRGFGLSGAPGVSSTPIKTKRVDLPLEGVAMDDPRFVRAFAEYRAKIKARRTRASSKPATEITEAKFVDDLIAGHSFEIKIPEAASQCRGCIGVGRVSPKAGKRDQDGKIECAECKGAGKVESETIVTVKW